MTGTQVDEQELPASNVVTALSRVMRDLPGIGKDSQASQQQGGYSYRGIEQITVHTQGLFARHGVVFVPHVRSYEVRDLVVNGKPWTDVYEMVEYTVYGPGGVEDRITVGPILAIGRDNSDKGGNKCLTQAFKYALLQALSISDAKDDGDGHTNEADARQMQPVEDPAVPGLRSSIEGAIAKLDDDSKVSLKAWFATENLPPVRRMNADQCNKVIDYLMTPHDEPTDESGQHVDGYVGTDETAEVA